MCNLCEVIFVLKGIPSCCLKQVELYRDRGRAGLMKDLLTQTNLSQCNEL